jgi:dihydroorotase
VSWLKLIELMTSRPAAIVKSDKGTLREGGDADVTIIDPNRTWTIDVHRFAGKSQNCPFDGWGARGRAVATIVAGDMKWTLAGPAGEEDKETSRQGDKETTQAT